MKKVLLIGDSIRMSYNERVKELLAGKADVWGPEENCRFAKYTLWEINGWISQGAGGKPDIIHWNNGIWDTFKISKDVEPFTPLDEYMTTMKQVYNEMKKSGAKIIFATTTPVGEKLSQDNNERIDEYNAAIVEFMKSEGVPINDLNSLIKENLEENIGEDSLHLNEIGVERASKGVADFIERYL